MNDIDLDGLVLRREFVGERSKAPDYYRYRWMRNGRPVSAGEKHMLEKAYANMLITASFAGVMGNHDAPVTKRGEAS